MTQPKLQLTTHRLDPAEAEVRIYGAADVSGRFMGPRCHYASTVEVAYYVKPLPGVDGGRVIVPEPSCWEPQTPFLYEAILQVRDGAANKRPYGLRTVELSTAGWRVNRKPFRVEGVFRRALNDATELRKTGVNTILCHVTPATASVWERADVLGFFVVGLLPNEPNAIALAQDLNEHPSCLAWIVEDGHAAEFAALRTNSRHEPVIGLRSLAPAAAAPWIRFVAGPAALSAVSLPWLQLVEFGEEAAAPLGRIRL